MGETLIAETNENKFPILTILIPVYNVEKYLRRCLDSLLVPEVMDDIETVSYTYLTLPTKLEV